ncbi:hypothetical protein IFR04_011426 [Cadophora malorum]|uniref:Heterokaryon incompatibility domain-containing protein n=1 Tax=Cadophora malorum TaxID=108018 RepID=A0A8H7T968_9HELO|nr:hypothetical protein IFR04_011426 [Cadophora malorum]
MFEHTTLSKYEYDILNPYTALSYVWGDASDQRIIWVDGQPFAVTKNLHKALESLRDDNKSLSIWADAICIDQLKIPKRNSQVTQMGRIYKNKLYLQEAIFSHHKTHLHELSNFMSQIFQNTERVLAHI